MATAGSSRYRVFSTHRFRNAPFSKFWASCTLIGSAAMIPLHQFNQYFLLTVPNAIQGKELWKCFTSKLFFLDAKDIIAGCALIYCLRSLERRMGTKKYINFLLVSAMTAISLELILSSALSYYVPSIRIPVLASGPYALLYSSFVQFVHDVPFVSVASIYNVPLAEKTIPCLLALLLFLSSAESRLACFAGLAAGIVYKADLFQMSKWSLIPNYLASQVDSLTEYFQTVGEDRRGRVLPLGATVEAQQSEAMDRFEQRMIYEQLRRQHMLDNQRPAGGMFLNAARRFFGAPMPLQGDGQRPQAAVNVPEEKIRTLTDMGFNNRQRVVDVLRSTGNDLNAAAHILLQQQE